MAVKREEPPEGKVPGAKPESKTARPTASGEPALRELQRTAGNRAVTEWLQRQVVTAAPPAAAPPAAATSPAAGSTPAPPASAAPAQPVAPVATDVLPRVRELLTRRALDWAITDADAREALNLLISTGDRVGALAAELGGELVTRLLDKLPADARVGPAYAKLVLALEPSLMAPYLTSLLSYRGLDWAITDSDVRRLLDVLRHLPPAGATQLADQLGEIGVGRLLENAPAGDLPAIARIVAQGLMVLRYLATLPRGDELSKGQKAIVKAVFDATPDTRVSQLMGCLGIRFRIEVSSSRASAMTGEGAPLDWDAPGLRRVYPVLEGLPPAQVSDNAAMAALGRYQAASTSGFYAPDEANIAYKAGTLGDLESGSFAQPGDPLFGVNIFDSTVRHEVGHAVERQLGVGPSKVPVSSAGWADYGVNHVQVAEAMIDDANGAIKTALTPDQCKDVVKVLVAAMANEAPAPALSQVQALPWFASLPAPHQSGVNSDPVFAALQDGLTKQMWKGKGGGTALGGAQSVYQADGTKWTRYQQAATGRKVSMYQFRAPGEWFAECYAAYYEPDARGRGAKLNDRDSTTKTWFDKNVHTMSASR